MIHEQDQFATKVAAMPLSTADRLTLLAARRKRYEESAIDRTIGACDDMHAETDAQYAQAGREALDLVIEAMILSGRTDFPSILDLPCGGGRVTRHLKAFFPDATIYASEIDPAKQAFVVQQFGALPHMATSDFSAPSDKKFDLIFVGSLVTHLPSGLYRAAVTYFLDALLPGGVLVITMHGRAVMHFASNLPTRLGRWRNRIAISRVPFRGFAYAEAWRRLARTGVRYGTSFNKPSWAAALIETRDDVRIIGLKERGWMDFQDVLMVQKRE
jgi:SAM-dependent methyltransferase